MMSTSMVRTPQRSLVALRGNFRVPAVMGARALSLVSTRTPRDHSPQQQQQQRSARLAWMAKSSINSSKVFTRSYATEGSQPATSSTASAKAPTSSSLSRTPLYTLHLEHEAKMVPFAGFEMPLTYKKGGQLLEHAQVRERAGLFDVSHMVQSLISGPSATRFLEHLLPASLDTLTPSAKQREYFKDTNGDAQGPFLSSLSLLLNEKGGIIDDLIITRQGEESYYLVTNAGRRKEDLEHITREVEKFNKKHGTNVKHEVMENRGLIALQGPKSANVLQKHLPASVNLDKLYFGHSIFTTFGPNKVNVHIARGGYTGEDGFEISVPGEESISVTKLLLGDANQVDTETGQPLATLVGLAARDSLRLEAGMCLYGHDLSEDVGPLEGGLTWVIGESRRADGTFIGAKPVLDAMASKARTQRRVGFLIEPGMVAREGSPIFVPGQSEQIGTITSGIPSPTLKQNIGMGYVQFGHHKIGTELAVKLCGKERKAKVTRMPFVKNNYHREPKE